MKVICVSGLKNSGKTTLIEALIPLLSEKGINAAVIKHHGHGFGDEIPDKPGTDTYRFLQNGAFGTIIYDDEMFSMVIRQTVSLEDLIALFESADLVIIEGAKTEAYPRIAMLRAGQPPPDDENNLLCAVTDSGYDRTTLPPGLPCFSFGDFEPIAGLIKQWI